MILANTQNANYDAALSRLTSTGWTVVSEGESGAQLKRPKKMRLSDKLCVAIGVPLVFLFGLGVILILIGVLDYAFFTKEPTHFLSRRNPAYPA